MNPIVLLFVAGAMLAWGVYVPTVHEGGKLLGGPQLGGPLRAFFCVGLAYFVVAIIVPLILAVRGTVKLEFNTGGFLYSSLAGVAGAVGALCVIFALKSGGTPWLVAPLVFAGAPIVNAVFSTWWHPTGQRPHPLYFVGMVLAAGGAFLVLAFKPDAAPAKPAKSVAVALSVEAAPPKPAP